MRSVIFAELVPGMVIYPKTDVNPPEEKYLNDFRIVQKLVQAGAEDFWNGGPAMYFLDPVDAHMGICCTGGHWVAEGEWWLIDDQPTLDKLRAAAKKSINSHRDNLDECERLVDDNL